MNAVLTNNHQTSSKLSGFGLRDAQGDLRWFEGVSSPELAAMAASFELKGSRGSARDLAAKSVSLAGLGAVGGEAFCTLGRVGVGRLQGFDGDRYEKESWLTQPANATDIGRLKAEVQGRRAADASAGHVLTAAGLAQEIPLWLLRQSDALLVAGDNLELLVWGGNLACGLGIPLLQGAVHGETWSAFARIYDFAEPGGPCPACAFSRADWMQLKSRHGCDLGTMQAQGIESTRTMPNVCRTAADLLSSETIKTLLNVDGRLMNEELSYCLLSHHVLRTHLERNPDCRCPHERWNLIDFDKSRAETTLAMLAVANGEELKSLHIRGELTWISFSICGGCGERVPIRQFGSAGMDVGSCACGEPLRATPVGVRSVIPADDLAEVADVSLEELQLPQGAAIGLNESTGEGATAWFFVGSPPELEAEPFHQRAATGAVPESE